jgi:hypothetical protein
MLWHAAGDGLGARRGGHSGGGEWSAPAVRRPEGVARIRVSVLFTARCDTQRGIASASSRFFAMRDGAAVLIPRRLLGVVVALLAGFSTALAEVRDVNSLGGGGATDVEYLYSPASDADPPDRSALDAYSPVASAAPRWFEAVLGWTGIEIWLVMLRDQFLADTTDSLGKPRFKAALPRLAPLHAGDALYLANITAAGRGSCGNSPSSEQGNSPSSEQAGCEVQQDPLSAGWTNPYSGASPSLDFNFAPTGRIGGGIYLPIRDEMSLGELEGLNQAMIAPRFGGGRGGVSASESTLNGRGVSASESMLNDATVYDPGPSAPGPRWSPGVTSDLLYPGPSVHQQIPASIPEPSIPVMLLIGVGSLALAARKKRTVPPTTS